MICGWIHTKVLNVFKMAMIEIFFFICEVENLTIFLLNKLSFFKGVTGAVSPISKEGKFSIMPWTQSMPIF